MRYEYKNATVLSATDAGLVEALISTYGVVDEKGDIATPGMFEGIDAASVRLLDNHNAESVQSSLGRVISIRSVGRDQLPARILSAYPEATGGAVATLKFDLDTPEGRGAFNRIKSGALSEFSIGYIAKQTSAATRRMNGKSFTARVLEKIKLFEISVVFFGAAPTAVLSTKSLDDVPNYHAAITGQAERCAGCRFYHAIKEGRGYCDKFDALIQPDYLCDSYAPGAQKSKLNYVQRKQAIAEIEAAMHDLARLETRSRPPTPLEREFALIDVEVSMAELNRLTQTKTLEGDYQREWKRIEKEVLAGRDARTLAHLLGSLNRRLTKNARPTKQGAEILYLFAEDLAALRERAFQARAKAPNNPGWTDILVTLTKHIDDLRDSAQAYTKTGRGY